MTRGHAQQGGNKNYTMSCCVANPAAAAAAAAAAAKTGTGQVWNYIMQKQFQKNRKQCMDIQTITKHKQYDKAGHQAIQNIHFYSMDVLHIHYWHDIELQMHVLTTLMHVFMDSKMSCIAQYMNLLSEDFSACNEKQTQLV